MANTLILMLDKASLNRGKWVSRVGKWVREKPDPTVKSPPTEYQVNSPKIYNEDRVETPAVPGLAISDFVNPS